MAEGRSQLVDELRYWQDRVYEDLISTPVLKQFLDYSRTLDEIKERLKGLPDEPASDNEVVELREELDRLKEDFLQQLAEQNLNKQELDKRVQTLENDIQILKQALQTTTKRQWGLMLFMRWQKWREKLSLRQLGTGARVLSKALPEGVSEELDLIRNVADGAADVIDEIDKHA